ncbi:hypothetical protein DFJ74DRAFT_372667 [Hyaloraphidium curvatum]|nr:hypothetical protein DFJ74DRAFT_372667 [Hyaloraphidium curvatum]
MIFCGSLSAADGVSKWLCRRRRFATEMDPKDLPHYTESQALYHYYFPGQDRTPAILLLADIDLLVIVAERPCARCGPPRVRRHRLGVPGPEPGSEGFRVRVRQTGWCSLLARGNGRGAIAGIGTAKEVCAASGGHDEIAWPGIAAVPRRRTRKRWTGCFSRQNSRVWGSGAPWAARHSRGSSKKACRMHSRRRGVTRGHGALST